MLETGHYALAGFVYQMLGSAADAISISCHRDPSVADTGLLTLEQFGQDAFVASVADGEAEQLIQYKHSTVGAELSPSVFRELANRFRLSAIERDIELGNVGFVLVTNRDPSPWANDLLDAQNDESQMQKLLVRGLKSEPENLGDLVIISCALEWRPISDSQIEEQLNKRAASLGVLPEEFEERTEQLLGRFLSKAASPTVRTVYRSDLDSALAGHAYPYSLRSSDSKQVQLDQVNKFREIQLGNQKTVARSVVSEIISAAMISPLTVVVGNGGLGKSIAAFDAVKEILRQDDSPPAFAMVQHASEICDQALMKEIASWRNLGSSRDGVDLSRSLERLKRSTSVRPYLTIYLDGIDEKRGQISLNYDGDRCVQSLVLQAFKELEQTGSVEISVIVSCRTADDLTGIVGPGREEQANIIQVFGFDDEELEQLARQCDDPVHDGVLEAIGIESTRGPKFPDSLVVNKDVVLLLRQPAVWGEFSILDRDDQIACLKGDPAGLDVLGRKYISRFESKAGRRIDGLAAQVTTTVLRDSAKLFANGDRRRATREEWASICEACDCGKAYREQLFNEAISGGVLCEDEGERQQWHWQQPWLCDYFSRCKVD